MGIVSLKSNLAINGTPDRYNTKGVLGNIDDPGGQRVNFSQLDIDKTPDTYNTQGKLKDSDKGTSRLDIDGTLDKYNTQGKLKDFAKDSSQLDITGTPDKYDTQGKLINFPKAGSQLDVDGTLERYDRLGKLDKLPPDASRLDFNGNLPAPTNVFLNTNALGFTIKNPVGISQFINDGQTSVYGFPGALPSAVNNILNINANGFTIRNPIGVSQFINGGQTSQLGFPGTLPPAVDNILNIHANGFTIKNPIGVSQFIGINGNTFTNPNGTVINTSAGTGIDFMPNTYAKGFTIKNPIGVTQFVGVNGNTFTNPNGTVVNTTPGIGVDFFINKAAKGFTIKNPVGISQFINGGQTSVYGFPGTLPPAVDNILNIHANGFTIKNPIGISQFIGINGNTFTNTNGIVVNTTPGIGVDFFISKAAKGFTIKNPIGVSQFIGINGNVYNNPTGNRLGLVNFFPNESSGATGFKDKLAPLESGFIGISADKTKYQYPATVKGARLLNVTLGPSGGSAKLENQLGAGSKMGNTGFYAEKRYSEAVRNDSNQSLLASWALREHSPSPLDTAYTYSSYYGHDLKLRSTAYNPTYMMHPLILRGLQNPDHLGPQRWGLTASPKGQKAAGGFAAALDGGFIRGGASTALERSAIDTARLAKFMASPKGIIWAITQVGLGKSNPLVEKNPENVIPFNDTRSHSGISTLLSVPGSAFGLHFTRHGIPFLNEAASYEKVIQYQTNNWSSYSPGNYDKSGNRLAKIKKELFGSQLPDPDSMPGARGLGQRVSNAVKGSENPVIQTISGLGGPGSVYGIGSTNIRRYVNTSLKKQLESKLWSDDIKREFVWFIADTNTIPDLTTGRYSIIRQYAPTLNQNLTLQGTSAEDKENAKNASNNYDDWNSNWANPVSPLLRNSPGRLLANLQGLQSNGSPQFSSTYFEKWNPGNGQITKDGPIKGLNEVSANNTNTNSGNTWNTLPYVEIRKTALNRKPNSTIVNDFRKTLLVSNEETFAASNLIPLHKKLENTVKSYEDKNASWTPGNRGENADGTGTNKNTNAYSDGTQGDAVKINTVKSYDSNTESGNKWSVLPYAEIRKIAKDRTARTTKINDFRTNLTAPTGESKTFSTSTDNVNLAEGNLSKRYGFGDHGNPNADRSDPYTRTSIDGDGQGQDRGNIDSAIGDLKNEGRFGITNSNGFRGDKITAIDYNPESKGITQEDIYPEGVRDFIKFYFSGIDLFGTEKDDVIVFRATVKGIADSFSPSWSTVSIMGRPDGPAIYSSFERNVSFNFTVAATSREELVPMWRKLNYLTSYTMPIYGSGRPGGALCRMTIGDMFHNTPGYFTGVTVSVNDEATWDLADDDSDDKTKLILNKKNTYSKQLPNLVDVDVQFKIIHDWRPQKGGRSYHLYEGNYTQATDPGSWLWDSNI